MRFEQNAVKFSKYFKPTLCFHSLKNSQLPSCHWCFVGRKSVRFKSTAWNTKSSSLPSSFHYLDLTFLCIIAALRSKCLKRARSLRSFLSSSSFYRDRIFRSSFYKRNFCQSIKCLNLLHRVKHTNCKILTDLTKLSKFVLCFDTPRP